MEEQIARTFLALWTVAHQCGSCEEVSICQSRKVAHRERTHRLFDRVPRVELLVVFDLCSIGGSASRYSPPRCAPPRVGGVNVP